MYACPSLTASSHSVSPTRNWAFEVPLDFNLFSTKKVKSLVTELNFDQNPYSWSIAHYWSWLWQDLWSEWKESRAGRHDHDAVTGDDDEDDDDEAEGSERRRRRRRRRRGGRQTSWSRQTGITLPPAARWKYVLTCIKQTAAYTQMYQTNIEYYV